MIIGAELEEPNNPLMTTGIPLGRVRGERKAEAMLECAPNETEALQYPQIRCYQLRIMNIITAKGIAERR